MLAQPGFYLYWLLLLCAISLAMTVKTEAARGTLTYSRMRGMVAILIGECRNKAGFVGYAKWKIF